MPFSSTLQIRKLYGTIARALFYLLIATLPFGTRLIFRMGEIGGTEIEPGTVSVFGTQILALFFVGFATLGEIRRWRRSGAACDWSDAACWSAIALWLVAVLSAWASGDVRAFVPVAWLSLGIVLFVAVRIIRPSVLALAASFAAGAAFQVSLAVYQVAAQSVPASKWLGMAAHLPSQLGASVVETAAGRWLRAYGTMPHPNMLGFYLAAAALLALALVTWRHRVSATLSLAVAASCSASLVLTLSRSAALGFSVGLLSFAVTRVFAREHVAADRHRSLVTLAIAATAAVALASTAFAFLDQVAPRLSANNRLERISVDERAGQLADSAVLFAAHPLFGSGPGMMPYELAARFTDQQPWDYQYVHNVPLLVLVETGPFGLLALLALVMLLARRAFYLLIGDISQAAVASIFLCLLTVGLFDHFLWSSWFGQAIFWIVAGLVCTPDKRPNTSQ